jgi:hypothetical protein
MLDPTQEESEAPGSRNPLALIGQLKPLLVLDKKKDVSHGTGRVYFTLKVE